LLDQQRLLDIEARHLVEIRVILPGPRRTLDPPGDSGHGQDLAMQAVMAWQAGQQAEALVLDQRQHGAAPPLAVGHAADLARIAHERPHLLEKLSCRLAVRAVPIESLAVERDPSIARHQRTEHDLLQVRPVILRVAVRHPWRLPGSVRLRTELLALMGTKEAERRGVEMQEVRPDVELLNDLQRDARHQSVKASGKQIVQGFGQAFLRELGKTESTVAHDGRHVVRPEAVGHAP